MATAALTCRVRTLLYVPSMRILASRVRVFSSFDQQESVETSIPDPRRQGEVSDTVWPDVHLGPLGARDQRFPFPGHVGAASQLSSSPHPKTLSQPRAPLPDILTDMTAHERQYDTVQQFLHSSVVTGEVQPDLQSALDKSGDMLECVAMDCPEKLRKDFNTLFTELSSLDDPLTVITLSQRTQNDMSIWSMDVEQEREELLGCFVTAAQQICEDLKKEGYWADFIDPSSGRAFFGPYTNNTMFETDERYRHLGFKIEDLGCCKVISHKLWGTHVYVGSLYTTAPSDGPAMQTLLKKIAG
ncbi:cobalamin trafficking protein CblD-like isoform X1 [Branchiostoma floridae x Branchiostoma belcheri]